MNLFDLVYGLSIGPHYCWHRCITAKYGAKIREKTGRVPDRFKSSATAVMGIGDPHFEAPCLWMHAVSVGEAVAAMDLARMFMEDNPRWEMRFSTTTATGRLVAERNWGEDAVFYYPLDFSWMVRRAFDNVRPSMIVLMELEIWPNFLAEAVRRQVPVVVANARITERSVKRLSLVPSVALSMAQAVEAWFAQTEEYALRLERIGVPANRIEVTGSVKYDAVPLHIDMVQARYYRRLFGCSETPYDQGGDLLLVAGSTHPGEERIILEALRSLDNGVRKKPGVVLTPRHPERLDEVEALAGRYGRVVRRSTMMEPMSGQNASAQVADIILVDTMGELSRIYTAADIVFVGGTLHPHGGQNFIEPCGVGKPTIVGPNLWNFQEPADLLTGAACLCKVATAEELPQALAEMIDNPQAATAMGEKAREVLLKQRGAARRMADRLRDLARAHTSKR